MRAVLLGLLLAVTAGLSGPAHAQELFPLQQVPINRGPAVVQSQVTHFDGGNQCAWSVPVIHSGDAVVGFVHATWAQVPQYPNSVTDNAGNTYHLTAGVVWNPYNEEIAMWYSQNVLGSPSTIYFNFPNSQNYCNVGFTEYSGVSGIITAGPVDDNAASSSPSITISPSASSLIWAFGATNTVDDASDLQTSGYSVLINDQSNNGLAVWGSNSMVSGSQTLTWSNPYYHGYPPTPGFCADGTAETNGCSTVMMAAAIH